MGFFNYILLCIHNYLRQFRYSYWWRAHHVGVYKPLFSKKCSKHGHDTRACTFAYKMFIPIGREQRPGQFCHITLDAHSIAL